MLNENIDIAKKIFNSCVNFPEITGGTNSVNCILTKLSKGRIFFKNGAEGVFLALIPEIKSALVVKIFTSIVIYLHITDNFTFDSCP